jgi:hypothetical protein
MTQELIKLSPAESPVKESIVVGKKQICIEEIVESFRCVGEDIEQISKLNSEEKLLVSQFIASLQKHMQPLTSSIEVSISLLPFELGSAIQAQIDPSGYLTLTFEDGHKQLLNLSEPKNRDLMMAVVGDFLFRFNELTSQIVAEKLVKSLPVEVPQIVQEIPIPTLPALEPIPAITVEIPLELEDSAPPEVPEEPIQEESVPEETPGLSADLNAKIAEITAETLGYLEQLGNEVFEYSPVSKYFDDWMVNLRQVILSFESSECIGPDEAFAKEYNQIFGDIEDELSKRLLNEAEIEVSARTLIENRYLMGKIDAGYAAQTKELVVKGKSAIDYLIRSVQLLEDELAEVEQIKTSYRHPLKKLAKEQKQAELTQKLNAAKKRLALAVGTSSVDKGKLGDVDAEYDAQTKELADKRKSAIDFLNKNVQDLSGELAEFKKIKTSSLHFLKKVAQEEKLVELTQKLEEAKKRLTLAEQNSGFEQEQLNAEYEKKKKATSAAMQTLEKDIAKKEIDDSSEARKAASKALANAVKALIERKTMQTSITQENE